MLDVRVGVLFVVVFLAAGQVVPHCYKLTRMNDLTFYNIVLSFNQIKYNFSLALMQTAYITQQTICNQTIPFITRSYLYC